MKRIAVIPARMGSKRLVNKNVLPVCGKPMLAYSIEAAIKSGIFDRVILSTDSPEYAEIGKTYGAETVFRGEHVSHDKASTFLVIEDLFEKIGKDFDYFVLLQPTSPLRTAQHVQEACEAFEGRMDECDFLVSMRRAPQPSIVVKPIEEDGTLKHFDVDFSTYKAPPYRDYMPNGAIFIAKPDAYLARKHFYHGAKTLSYIMSADDSVDVDNEIDYKFICLLMEERLKEQNNG